MSHIINDHHLNRICNLLADHKGTVVVGNGRAHIDKNLTPTVVLNPSLQSELMKEEIFGPILPVVTYRSFNEAVEIINSKEKPLVVYYFGKQNSANYKRLEFETSSGALVTNEANFHGINSFLPFGGVG